MGTSPIDKWIKLAQYLIMVVELGIPSSASEAGAPENPHRPGTTIDIYVSSQSPLQPDNAGLPDYYNLAKKHSFLRLSRDTNDRSKADYYIREEAIGLPVGFKEPLPFILDAEQWAIYSERKSRIVQRMNESLLGTNFG